MIELLVGSTVMLVAIIGALFIYARSNKVSVEQQMVTEVQNDVRASMFFVTRDLRMAGAGLPVRVLGLFPRGRGQRGPGRRRGPAGPDHADGQHRRPAQPAHPNRTRARRPTLGLQDFSFEQYSYPDEFYDKQGRPRPAQSRRRAAGRARSATSPT
ncbi:MAG: hypothetical protein MZW92_61430 [Comamonadaceae bacterium]|nr:hypothetical protein [Comamonadaceae bacterium]